MADYPNEHIIAARKAKAAKLVDVLDAADATLDQVLHLDTRGRVDTAKAAGVNAPSHETWALVVAHFEGRAAVLAALPDDPFEGLAP